MSKRVSPSVIASAGLTFNCSSAALKMLGATCSSLESTRVPSMSKMKARSTEVEAYRKSDATCARCEGPLIRAGSASPSPGPWRPLSTRRRPSPRRWPLSFRQISSQFFPSIMDGGNPSPRFLIFPFVDRFEFQRADGCSAQSENERRWKQEKLRKDEDGTRLRGRRVQNFWQIRIT
jgi:hypothetical protein